MWTLCLFVCLPTDGSFSSRPDWSAQDGPPLGGDQLARGGVVRPGQAVQVWGGRPLAVGQALVLLPANHLALVGDGLDVVLVLVARLVQGMLGKNTTTRLNYGTIRKALFQFN